MPKYDELLCPRCNKETIHRIKNRFGVTKKGSRSSGAFLKYQAKHCLVCNLYWGYSKKEPKAERMVSLR